MRCKLILGLTALFLPFIMALSGGVATAGPAETGVNESGAGTSSGGVETARMAKKSGFWCGGSFRIIATRTFGPSDWRQELGVRDSDNARAIRVYHPSGRWDRYRFRFMERDGSVWTGGSQHTTEWCVIVAPGIGVQPEANNGYGWKTGYWMNR